MTQKRAACTLTASNLSLKSHHVVMVACGNFASILDFGQISCKKHADNRDITHLSLHLVFKLFLA